MRPPMHSKPKPDRPSDPQQKVRETLTDAADRAAQQARQAGEHFVSEPAHDLLKALKTYTQQKPEVAALWCIGLGAWIGWRLRG